MHSLPDVLEALAAAQQLPRRLKVDPNELRNLEVCGTLRDFRDGPLPGGGWFRHRGGWFQAVSGVLMRQGREHPYFESLLAVSWLVPTVFGRPLTYLKGRPGRVQAVFIAGLSASVIAIAF